MDGRMDGTYIWMEPLFRVKIRGIAYHHRYRYRWHYRMLNFAAFNECVTDISTDAANLRYDSSRY